MDIQQPLPDLVEAARVDALEKYSKHLTAELSLARQDGGFFEKRYWEELVITKTDWQEASNKFYILLHELAK